MEINEKSPRKKRAGVRKLIRHSTKVDLTPMVDLGFLLLTFFVFTSSIASPNAMAVHVPKDEGNPTPVCNSCALTVVPVGGDKIYYFEGDASLNPSVDSTNFAPAGIRKLILKKMEKIRQLNDPDRELVLAIKPGEKASFKNFVDILDEVTINQVKHYFIASLDDADKKLLGKLLY